MTVAEAIVTRPVLSVVMSTIESTALSTRSRISTASGSSRLPASVSPTKRVCRSNRLAPSWPSSSLMRMLTADWVRLTASAASRKRPHSATATNVLSCFKVTLAIAIPPSPGRLSRCDIFINQWII